MQCWIKTPTDPSRCRAEAVARQKTEAAARQDPTKAACREVAQGEGGDRR